MRCGKIRLVIATLGSLTLTPVAQWAGRKPPTTADTFNYGTALLSTPAWGKIQVTDCYAP